MKFVKVMFSQVSVCPHGGAWGYALQGGERHAWQGVCIAGSVCLVGGGMHGRVVCIARGACVAVGGRAAWQERRPLQRVVRILRVCILVIFF